MYTPFKLAWKQLCIHPGALYFCTQWSPLLSLSLSAVLKYELFECFKLSPEFRINNYHTQYINIFNSLYMIIYMYCIIFWKTSLSISVISAVHIPLMYKHASRSYLGSMGPQLISIRIKVHYNQFNFTILDQKWNNRKINFIKYAVRFKLMTYKFVCNSLTISIIMF